MNADINILVTAVQNAGRGDANARSFLYNQYSKAMFNICIRMMGNRENAEDVLQDCFITAFRKIGQLKEAKSFGGWLKRIVITECIRANKKDRWSELTEQYDAESNTGESWLEGITIECIHEAIKALPDGCRQVFNLFAIENMSHREIADALEVSESTSKSQYFRARQLLRERLTKQLTHG